MLTNRTLIKSNLTPGQLQWVKENCKDVTFKHYFGWLINIICHLAIIGILLQVYNGNRDYLARAEIMMWGYSLLWTYMAMNPILFLFSKSDFRWVASVVNSPVWKTNKYILLAEDITQGVLAAFVAVLSLAVDPAFVIIIVMMYSLFIYYRVVATDVLVGVCERNIPDQVFPRVWYEVMISKEAEYVGAGKPRGEQR